MIEFSEMNPKDFFVGILQPGYLPWLGAFDVEAIKALLSRKDWGSTEIANKIWTLVNFQI